MKTHKQQHPYRTLACLSDPRNRFLSINPSVTASSDLKDGNRSVNSSVRVAEAISESLGMLKLELTENQRTSVEWRAPVGYEDQSMQERVAHGQVGMVYIVL